MKTNILKKVLVLSLIILAGIGFIAYAFYKSNQKLLESALWVQHTELVINQSDRILSLAKDIETASRGFVITNDSILLEPLYTAKKSAFSSIRQLGQLTLDDRLHQQRIDSLNFYMQGRLDFSSQMIELRSKQGLASAIAFTSTKQGKVYTDHISQITNAIQREERNLLEQRKQTNQNCVAAFNRFIIAMFILLAVFTILLLITAGKYFLQNREKGKRAAELIIANNELDFQNKEKQKRASELIIANEELIFQNEEKEKRAAELVLANIELLFQNKEKEKRAAELITANEELAFQNKEKNTVLERIDDGFFAVNENSIVTYWNKRAEILLNTKREDIIGKNLHDVFAANHPNIFYDHYQKAIREKSTVRFEGFSKLSNKWLAVNAFASDNGLSVYFKDVTEQKNGITELKESEKRYSDLFHLSPQPMWLFDTKTFRFVQVNKAATELYGYSEKEFLNMTLMDIKLEEDIFKVTKHIRDYKPEDGIHKGKFVHHKKSGEAIEVDIYSTPIIINDRSCRSVIVIDVTDKNHNEHKIIKAIIKTQEDERYEIGGELHDNVCQVLAASQLNLGMLKNSLPTSKMLLFDQCNGNIRLALDEIRNLSHRLAPVFFDDSTMEEAFRRLFDTFNIGEKTEFALHIDNAVGEHTISLDIQLNLYRILQEQLRNIQKYASATIVEVDLIIYKNKLKMKISDNGIGFNVDIVKEGIGLANMARRAELFSGKFEIDSSPGNGCTILIDIPLNETILNPLVIVETIVV